MAHIVTPVLDAGVVNALSGALGAAVCNSVIPIISIACEVITGGVAWAGQGV